MNALADAIADVYRQVGAPQWARCNLDALADVLRDLSWVPPGDVVIAAPALEGSDGERLSRVLAQVAADTAGGERPVRVVDRR